MQTYTPKQLESAVEAGGIKSVTIAARGTRFYIEVESRTGAGVLTKARSPDPRTFTNPTQAFTELRRLGVHNGTFDTTRWTPEQHEAPARPDRAQAMSEIYEMAGHARWVRERVAKARAEAADPNTQWVDQSVIEADSDVQRKRLEDRLNNAG